MANLILNAESAPKRSWGFPRGLQRCSAVLGVSPMSDCIKTGADAGSAHSPSP
ncbi:MULTISPECIES: hypothetical protein [Moorena]|uniref:hypothetical protein n=1 Tax=Moorena TaxID=1155738 RepID=UPI0012B5F1E5|nr:MULTISPECIES: hypothetical protein [Moorena]NEP36833.1 hypothetical protein [Moorena sp. SIO3B2]NEP36891.1 hypothetical protein [Moorena sp. SIO3B2]NEQ11318.1 hypothetical protein [Moorena sp. SIO4E2]NER92058.1 hypothetical protein [Moorena sp. SIO3A2]NER92060.1 hypothetical protein [Moorena sp. SIO3A2]